MVDNKQVIQTSSRPEGKKGGAFFARGFAMLMKTNIEKMSVSCPLAMLMKQNKIQMLSGDLPQKKGVNEDSRRQF
jgi:hypothetical protein